MFNNKTLLITGGTGSFGNVVLSGLIESDLKEIRIFSRDEKKQDDMRKKFDNPKVKFYLGDVRQKRSIEQAMRGVDYVFHAAALKQVPSCEFYPMQAVYTNVIGTENVLETAILEGVSRVVCLSTDKAVYPINAMGISKAMMEKVIVSTSKNVGNSNTTICATRYGNVLASRGSVVPLFIQQLKNGADITITDPNMTRFMMTLNDALNLVLYAFENGNNGDIFVQKAPASTVEVIANAVREIFDHKDHPISIIGTRHGEKLFESLLTTEEMSIAVDLGEYYKVPPDGRDLNYSRYIEKGMVKLADDAIESYNSHNTRRLNLEETKNLLMKVDYVKEELGF